jgi:predicted dehydrogenase
MSEGLNRRDFVRASAAIGAGLYAGCKGEKPGDAVSEDHSGHDHGAVVKDAGDAVKKDTINVALLGAGAQGQVLMDALIKARDKSIRFVAVCDIWEPNREKVRKRLKAYGKYYGYRDAAYTDYKEMLDTEKDLDAVIIATPDFWHAEHTIACLNKGLHVYCEKEMSNTLEGAKKMLDAQKKTGKLLQRYIHCYDKLIKEANLLNRITTINGQWNRSKSSCQDIGWVKGTELDEATLNKYGFKNMHQFRNWRWFKGLGGGPIVDLGSHQIDIFSWFLGVNPTNVIASGGVDYWKGHEWYDSVMAIYEYETKQGKVRALYQTSTTNSSNGYFENFMGDEGSLMISESGGRGSLFREGWVHDSKWQPWVDKGYITKVGGKPAVKTSGGAVLDVREGSSSPAEYGIPVTMDVPYHQPHLLNFFNSIHGTDKLNCPAKIGYETAVAVLKVNEAVEKKCRLEFKPSEFDA